MTKPRRTPALLQWYKHEKQGFEKVARDVESILKNLIKKKGIPVVSVTSRVKSDESLIKKLRRKRYKHPKIEITDFVGLRVITYTEDNAKAVCDLVKASFGVDLDRSLDKSQQLDVDQIGYRSHHYICNLGENRLKLPEFEAFQNLTFEIQIRTVLQHAWAEVEHDRNYKFSGLPPELQRRLYLISGMLEIGDRELNQLSRDIDEYVKNVGIRLQRGKLSTEGLNSTTLPVVLPKLLRPLKKAKIDLNIPANILAEVVSECRTFGLKTVTELELLFTQEFYHAFDKTNSDSNAAGVIRDAMMYWDFDRYLDTAWQQNWTYCGSETVALLKHKYSIRDVYASLRKHGIEIIDIEPSDDFAEFDMPEE